MLNQGHKVYDKVEIWWLTCTPTNKKFGQVGHVDFVINLSMLKYN